MNIKDQIRAELTIWKVALQAGKTTAMVRKDMQAAIDIAWSADNPETMSAQQDRFPDGKPTVEEFLLELSKQI